MQTCFCFSFRENNLKTRGWSWFERERTCKKVVFALVRVRAKTSLTSWGLATNRRRIASNDEEREKARGRDRGRWLLALVNFNFYDAQNVYIYITKSRSKQSQMVGRCFYLRINFKLNASIDRCHTPTLKHFASLCVTIKMAAPLAWIGESVVMWTDRAVQDDETSDQTWTTIIREDVWSSTRLRQVQVRNRAKKQEFSTGLWLDFKSNRHIFAASRSDWLCELKQILIRRCQLGPNRSIG